jgi:hypothetical protein
MTTPRHDLYAFIHKGLRAFMAHTLVRVGRVDPHDEAEFAEVAEELRALLHICADHLANENEVVHVAMEARCPGSSAHIAADHLHHSDALARLEDLLQRAAGSAEGVHALYHALGSFVAHNFEHMEEEETAHNAVLWSSYSDDELRALEHTIIARHTPEQMGLALRWMLPHMNPAERAAMLGGMRASAPAPVFEGALGLLRPLLGGRDWRKLSLALGL